ncbi:hypothetical protein [Nonomuraea glycinis]|uniref:hypothetical protein n=1 Tax=Nonomuraea glycinis TaxID=2047744 RepID=UPI002E12AC55|nr:hypothetical protein OHA68_32495 [Nonomuraea glycinis]
MRQTERRGRILLIATALTGTLMLALAGVLSTGGSPGASLSPASVSGFQRPAKLGAIESAPVRVPAPEPSRRPLLRGDVDTAPPPPGLQRPAARPSCVPPSAAKADVKRTKKKDDKRGKCP